MTISRCSSPPIGPALLGRMAWGTGLAVIMAACLAMSQALAAGAESYPEKPISLIVSYPAGGSVDVAARILQDPLSNALGQPVVIENKGGAGGTIGTGVVAKAKPDGYTLLITLSSHTINPAIYDELPFDTVSDLSSISMVASAPQILVANPEFPPSSLEELIEYAKKQDRKSTRLN